MCKKHRMDLRNPFICSNFAANFKKMNYGLFQKDGRYPA